MKLSVSLSGDQEVLRTLQKITAEQEKKVAKALNIAAINVEREAKKNAPVDNGRLRSSIRIKFFLYGPTIAYSVYTDVKYSVWQEFGTGRYAAKGDGRKTPWVYQNPKTKKWVRTVGNHPHPFMYPAWAKERPKMLNRIANAMKV